MRRLIETDFPYSEVSDLARRERRNPRPYQLIHPWPGRRPGILFKALILASLLPENAVESFWELLRLRRRENVAKGKVFLDPFMGSGTSLVEALSLGMRAVGVDVNTVAWFIARETLRNVDLAALKTAVRRVVREVGPLAKSLYSTENGKRLTWAKVFYWVKTIRCENCGNEVHLFKQYKLAKTRSGVWAYCPHCSSVVRMRENGNVCPLCGRALEPTSWGEYYRCPACGYEGGIVDAVDSAGKPGMRLFAVMYRARGAVKVREANEHDLERYREAEALARKVPPSFLDMELRFGEETSRILRYGYSNVRELFNARQLVLLYAIFKAVSALPWGLKEPLSLALSKTMAFSSQLTPFYYKKRGPESMFALHQFMHEKMYMEVNPLDEVRGSFLNNAFRVIEAKDYIAKCLGDVTVATSYEDFEKGADALVLRGTATDTGLPSRSVDLIVTDPPHLGNVINSGIADFHYAILRPLLRERYSEFSGERSCDESQEIVVDPARRKSLEEYGAQLTRAFREARRVLKREGLMVVLFRHRSQEAWDILYSSLEKAGFRVVKEWPLNVEGNIQPQAKFTNAKEAAVACRLQEYNE